jgi:hypothetical protein
VKIEWLLEIRASYFRISFWIKYISKSNKDRARTSEGYIEIRAKENKMLQSEGIGQNLPWMNGEFQTPMTTPYGSSGRNESNEQTPATTGEPESKEDDMLSDVSFAGSDVSDSSKTSRHIFALLRNPQKTNLHKSEPVPKGAPLPKKSSLRGEALADTLHPENKTKQSVNWSKPETIQTVRQKTDASYVSPFPGDTPAESDQVVQLTKRTEDSPWPTVNFDTVDVGVEDEQIFDDAHPSAPEQEHENRTPFDFKSPAMSSVVPEKKNLDDTVPPWMRDYHLPTPSGQQQQQPRIEPEPWKSPSFGTAKTPEKPDSGFNFSLEVDKTLEKEEQMYRHADEPIPFQIPTQNPTIDSSKQGILENQDEDIKRTKQMQLHTLERLRLGGAQLTRKFTMEDTLDDINFECETHMMNRDLIRGVNNLSENIKYGCVAAAALNDNMGPYFNSKKFLERTTEMIDNHQSDVEAIYRTYFNQRGSGGNPVVSLCMGFVGIVVMTFVEEKLGTMFLKAIGKQVDGDDDEEKEKKRNKKKKKKQKLPSEMPFARVPWGWNGAYPPYYGPPNRFPTYGGYPQQDYTYYGYYPPYYPQGQPPPPPQAHDPRQPHPVPQPYPPSPYGYEMNYYPPMYPPSSETSFDSQTHQTPEPKSNKSPRHENKNDQINEATEAKKEPEKPRYAPNGKKIRNIAPVDVE